MVAEKEKQNAQRAGTSLLLRKAKAFGTFQFRKRRGGYMSGVKKWIT